jgi:hypothetical protein
MKFRIVCLLALSSFLTSCSLETETLPTTTTSTLSPQEVAVLEWSEATNGVVERLVESNGRLVASFMNINYGDDSWVLAVASDLLTLGSITLPESILVPDIATQANNTLKEAIDVGYLVFQDMPNALDQGNSALVRRNIARLDDMTNLLEQFGMEVSTIISTLQ